MTKVAPAKWSFHKTDKDTYQIWVDGSSRGNGTLLGTFTFDPDWNEDAHKVNLTAICEDMNARDPYHRAASRLNQPPIVTDEGLHKDAVRRVQENLAPRVARDGFINNYD